MARITDVRGGLKSAKTSGPRAFERQLTKIGLECGRRPDKNSGLANESAAAAKDMAMHLGSINRKGVVK